MKSKRGFMVWMVIAIVVALMVLSLFAAIYGLKFLAGASLLIEWRALIVIMVTILLIVFRGVVGTILMTVWSWVIGIVNIFKGLF
jgi:hypothetical protein